MFLYYLLVLRLRKKQPTYFQYSPDFVVLFDKRGVSVVSPFLGDRNAPDDAWALIDSNTKVKTVPWIFERSDSPNFVVLAASPRSERWKSLRHNRSNTRLWIMEPFTLEELLQVSVIFSQLSSLTQLIFQSCTSIEATQGARHPGLFHGLRPISP